MAMYWAGGAAIALTALHEMISADGEREQTIVNPQKAGSAVSIPDFDSLE